MLLQSGPTCGIPLSILQYPQLLFNYSLVKQLKKVNVLL